MLSAAELHGSTEEAIADAFLAEPVGDDEPPEMCPFARRLYSVNGD
jgi:hypothetical protein